MRKKQNFVQFHRTFTVDELDRTKPKSDVGSSCPPHPLSRGGLVWIEIEWFWLWTRCANSYSGFCITGKIEQRQSSSIFGLGLKFVMPERNEIRRTFGVSLRRDVWPVRIFVLQRWECAPSTSNVAYHWTLFCANLCLSISSPYEIDGNFKVINAWEKMRKELTKNYREVKICGRQARGKHAQKVSGGVQPIDVRLAPINKRGSI